MNWRGAALGFTLRKELRFCGPKPSLTNILQAGTQDLLCASKVFCGLLDTCSCNCHYAGPSTMKQPCLMCSLPDVNFGRQMTYLIHGTILSSQDSVWHTQVVSNYLTGWSSEHSTSYPRREHSQSASCLPHPLPLFWVTHLKSRQSLRPE